MFEKLKAKLKERTQLKKYGCVCYCPSCRLPLQGAATWFGDEEGLGDYKCPCGYQSMWHFGIAPMPICISDPAGDKERCPVCHKDWDRLDISVSSWWLKMTFRPHMAVICRSCKEIVGYE